MLLLKNESADQLKLPKWVNVSEERFNEVLSTVTKAKSNGLKTSIDERKITIDNAECLLKRLGSGKIGKSEFKKSAIILLMMLKQYYSSQWLQEVKIK